MMTSKCVKHCRINLIEVAQDVYIENHKILLRENKYLNKYRDIASS